MCRHQGQATIACPRVLVTVDYLTTLEILASLSAVHLENSFVTGTPTAQPQGHTHMFMKDLVTEHNQPKKIAWTYDTAVRRSHLDVRALKIDMARQMLGIQGHSIVMIDRNGLRWTDPTTNSIKVGGKLKYQGRMRETPPCLLHGRIFLSTQIGLLLSMEVRAPIEHNLMIAGLSLQDRTIIRISNVALEGHHQRELMTVALRATTGDVTIVHQTDIGQSKT